MVFISFQESLAVPDSSLAYHITFDWCVSQNLIILDSLSVIFHSLVNLKQVLFKVSSNLSFYASLFTYLFILHYWTRAIGLWEKYQRWPSLVSTECHRYIKSMDVIHDIKLCHSLKLCFPAFPPMFCRVVLSSCHLTGNLFSL